MTKNNSSPKSELSYYGLSLLSYQGDSHPDKTGDKAFISGHDDRAAGVYSEAIQSGLTHIEAEEQASAELYRDLHFSAYNMLVNILWDEFSAEIPEDDALQVLPLCGNVLAKYTLTDDFADTPRPFIYGTRRNHSNTSGRWHDLTKRSIFARILKP